MNNSCGYSPPIFETIVIIYFLSLKYIILWKFSSFCWLFGSANRPFSHFLQHFQAHTFTLGHNISRNAICPTYYRLIICRTYVTSEIQTAYVELNVWGWGGGRSCVGTVAGIIPSWLKTEQCIRTSTRSHSRLYYQVGETKVGTTLAGIPRSRGNLMPFLNVPTQSLKVFRGVPEEWVKWKLAS